MRLWLGSKEKLHCLEHSIHGTGDNFDDDDDRFDAQKDFVIGDLLFDECWICTGGSLAEDTRH